MKRVISIVSLLALLIACRPPDLAGSAAGRLPEGTQGRIEIADTPAVGPALIRVHLADESGPISGAQVTVTGDMTHAGMVPVIREAVEEQPGVYGTVDFEFTMGGDWFVLAAVELDDGSRFELTPYTTSVRSN